jgi:hypothetical protein
VTTTSLPKGQDAQGRDARISSRANASNEMRGARISIERDLAGVMIVNQE